NTVNAARIQYWPDELQEILRLHELWVRGKEGGKRADLRHADLAGIELPEAFLHGICLRKTDLRGALLYHAQLGEADLRDCDLSLSNLAKGILHDPDWSGCLMPATVLPNAGLWKTDLGYTSLIRCDATGPCLAEARLHRTRFEDVRLDGACFFAPDRRG